MMESIAAPAAPRHTTHGLTPPLDAIAWRVRLRTAEPMPRTLQCALLARTEEDAGDIALDMHFPDGLPDYAVRVDARPIRVRP